tara:strand:- start:119601 stop:119765 length:165 start_codon:yes stop_codon:yes gene_type:complete
MFEGDRTPYIFFFYREPVSATIGGYEPDELPTALSRDVDGKDTTLLEKYHINSR